MCRGGARGGAVDLSRVAGRVIRPAEAPPWRGGPATCLDGQFPSPPLPQHHPPRPRGPRPTSPPNIALLPLWLVKTQARGKYRRRNLKAGHYDQLSRFISCSIKKTLPREL